MVNLPTGCQQTKILFKIFANFLNCCPVSFVIQRDSGYTLWICAIL